MKRLILLPALAVAALPASAEAPTSPRLPAPVAATVVPAVVPSEAIRPKPKWRAKRRWRPNPAAAAVVRATRDATHEPAKAGFINAVQVYPYSEGTLYRLFAAPEHVTDIALQPGETLGAVAAGDTVRWVIGDTPSGAGDTKRTHILVKPVRVGLTTNLVITTDRRVYHLTLVSTARSPMIALSWSYPADDMMALARGGSAPTIAANIPVEGLNFNYRIGGDKPAWRPVRAFDDGRQTYVEFPADLAVGEAPPLFLTDKSGAAQLVNYRQKGRYYVVDRLFQTAELRLGTKHQDIVKIDRLGQRRGKGS